MTLNKILISGAGIAGLSLARRCQQLDIPFKLIEKQSQSTTTGTGIALPANALSALRHMRLGSSVEEQAHRVETIIYTKPSGHILSQASLNTPPLNSDHFMALHRSKLHDILLDGLESKIRFNTTATDINESDTGVTVKFNNSESEEEYSAVIGADGINSGIRQLTFGDIDLVDLSVTNWRWTCAYPTRDLQPTYMLGSKDAFMAYPIGENEVYCYAHLFDPENAFNTNNDHATTIKTNFNRYADIASHLMKRLPPSSDITPGRLRSVPHPFFSSGRIALVGDASNACSPMLQQGAACAFEDVVILSEFLSHFPVKDALKHYEDYRKERVTWIINASDTPMKSLVKASPLTLFARDMYIRFNGPLNVKGWETLLKTDPIADLPAYIERCKQENKYPTPT